MNHCNFEESNSVFKAPADMKDCSDLHAYKGVTPEGFPFIISSWDLTKEEILSLLLFRRVWLHVWQPVQPPVYVGATSPFVNATSELPVEERMDNFKERLINLFLSESEYELDKRVELIPVLDKFLKFLSERGE